VSAPKIKQMAIFVTVF